MFMKYINLEEGKVRIGGGVTLLQSFLIDPIKEFAKKYPKIEIKIEKGLSDELIEKLSNGELDLIFLDLPSRTQRTNIEIKPLKKLNYCLAISKELLGKNKISSVTDLEKYPLIFPKIHANMALDIEEFLKEENANLKPMYEISSPNVILDFVKNGIGIGYINKGMIEEQLESGELIEVKVGRKLPIREVGIAMLNKDLTSSATIKLAEIIQEYSER